MTPFSRTALVALVLLSPAALPADEEPWQMAAIAAAEFGKELEFPDDPYEVLDEISREESSMPDELFRKDDSPAAAEVLPAPPLAGLPHEAVSDSRPSNLASESALAAPEPAAAGTEAPGMTMTAVRATRREIRSPSVGVVVRDLDLADRNDMRLRVEIDASDRVERVVLRLTDEPNSITLADGACELTPRIDGIECTAFESENEIQVLVVGPGRLYLPEGRYILALEVKVQGQPCPLSSALTPLLAVAAGWNGVDPVVSSRGGTATCPSTAAAH